MKFILLFLVSFTSLYSFAASSLSCSIQRFSEDSNGVMSTTVVKADIPLVNGKAREFVYINNDVDNSVRITFDEGVGAPNDPAANKSPKMCVERTFFDHLYPRACGAVVYRGGETATVEVELDTLALDKQDFDVSCTLVK